MVPDGAIARSRFASSLAPRMSAVRPPVHPLRAISLGVDRRDNFHDALRHDRALGWRR